MIKSQKRIEFIGMIQKSNVKEISMKRYANVFQRECVACGTCVKVCPRDAIAIVSGMFAEVNPNKCVGCSLCAKACPASVIDMKEFDE